LSGSGIGVVCNFDYGFKNAGNDIINDFTAGNIKTNANADIIDLRDLLVGYSATSNFSDFVTAAAEGTGECCPPRSGVTIMVY
jgi:hypothetical protein